MQMVVAGDEDYVDGAGEDGCGEEVGEGWGWEEEVAGGDECLGGHIDEGDSCVGDAEFVGHYLVHMFAVCLEDVFAEHYTVNYCEDSIYTVN